MRGSVALGGIGILCALAFAGCGNGKVIGSGPQPTPTPATPKVSYEYKVPTAGAEPISIVTGADGYLYFTESAKSQIGKLSTGGVFKEFPTKTAGAIPGDIIIGPDNNLWWSEQGVHSIATMSNYTTNAMTEYAIPWANADPGFMTKGLAQNTIFFVDDNNNAIGQVSTAGVFAGPFSIPTANADPQGLVVGPDNNLWFCEYGAGKIGHFNTSTNTVDHEYVIGAGSRPADIIVGPDGALWFTDDNPAGPQLGRITTTGVINEYPLKGAKNATGIIEDLFGNFEIVDSGNNAIGQFIVNTLGYTEYPITTPNSQPVLEAIGPDARIYFTEEAANQIGQFSYF